MKTTDRLIKALYKMGVSSYGGYLLSWDVKITFHPSVEQTLQKMADSFYINRTELFTMYPAADSVVSEYLNKADLFNHVCESMWESWTDADTYSMCSPERLKAWGLPYGKDAPGVKGPFKVKYSLHGRGGGHLVVEEFEGVSLRHLDLADDDFNLDPTWLRMLGAMAEEWNDILQPTKVYDEYKYTIAWMVNNQLEEAA